MGVGKMLPLLPLFQYAHVVRTPSLLTLNPKSLCSKLEAPSNLSVFLWDGKRPHLQHLITSHHTSPPTAGLVREFLRIEP